MKILKPILISFFLALAVSSCMVGPKLEKPVVDAEEQFRFDSIAGDSMINMAWWELFSDPQLDTMVATHLVGLDERQHAQRHRHERLGMVAPFRR